jgi:hypothetical protein
LVEWNVINVQKSNFDYCNSNLPKLIKN